MSDSDVRGRPDWERDHAAASRRPSSEARRESIDALLRGASILLAEARLLGQESLSLGLSSMVASVRRLKELESAPRDEARRTVPPSPPRPRPDAASAASPIAPRSLPVPPAPTMSPGGTMDVLEVMNVKDEPFPEAVDAPFAMPERPILSRRSTAPAGAGSGARLLVVDDNPLNREMLIRRLKLKGYRMDEASDGYEALEKLRAEPYDLVLLDIM
ncbi:MAG: response regulator, partial [Thermoanaerobaculia bacterium]